MSLAVVDAGGIAAVQDAGRTGWRKFGVPASGPMDLFAFRAANALAGNPAEYASIEIGLGDVTFQATRDCILAATGAGYRVSVYVWEFSLWSAFFVRGGWKVHLRKTDDGMWAYLAVHGGIQTPPLLGSRSTYLRGGFGGYEGRQLQAGDVLSTGASRHVPYELAARTLPAALRPDYREHPTIGVIMGPQRDRFDGEGIAAFLGAEYSLQLTSDRMGYRLEGPAVAPRNRTELISEGMAFGAIQVPPGGQPIVMMADGPTVGGYPKIAAVASADLPVLAQCVPRRSKIRFRETTVEAAQARYRALMQNLAAIANEESP